MATATFRIWRAERGAGKFHDYTTEVSEGMVVLDAVHHIQAEQANDLAVRWNCKAGKCGSCSAEINGMPKLMCMTRLNSLPLDQPVTIEPMKAFPHIKDLVTDVSWNFAVKKEIAKFKRSSRGGLMHPTARGAWRSRMWTACRSSASASSASFARTSATCCATITCTTNLSVRGSWCTRRRWRCTRSM
jgi:succinate dehydrogenase/fumarate reductase iron-sulfur protein